MKQIEKFMLPEHTNNLYEKEAISSISLTKEVASKINEIVEAINQLSQVDLEWKQIQEGTIRKGVLFMKDNLVNSLNDLMQLLLESGFVDERIKYHSVELTNELQTLAGRLSSLLGSVTVGTTSMDAEIIDGRTGAKGEQYATIGNAIRGQFKNQAYTIKEVVTDANYKSVLPDADLVDEPCTYQINFTRGSTDITANLPYEAFNSNVDELITFKDKYYRQLLIGNTYMYTRYGVKTSSGIEYYGWYCIYDKEKADEIQRKSYKSKGIVTTADYNIILPDANKILENSIYQLNFNYGSEEITANLPYTRFTGRIDELITFADKYYRQLLLSDKYIYTRNGILSSTRDSVDYGSWICIWTSDVSGDVPEFIVDKAGSGNYTSLTKCIHDNNGRKCVIRVRPGVYDLIEEGTEYFGSAFLDGTSDGNSGLPVSNGTQIFMDAGAVVKYIYTGTNANLVEYFSPFIMSGAGGEIYGGKIECQNCRYAIHDDVYDSSSHSKSVIDGVHIHYNSARNVCIGGGFGQSSHITVRNCTIINGNNDNKGYGIFYHNSASGNSQSYLAIENNFVDGPIVVESYGPSTNISSALVSGNKCTEVRKIIEGSVDNIQVYEFNNVT